MATYVAFLRHLQLGHAHVAAHAEHDAEAEARQQRYGVPRSHTWTLCLYVFICHKND